MKKLIIFLVIFFLTLPSYAVIDKYSKEYLQSNKHFSPINPFVEMIVQHEIKSALKKETGGKYKVKFSGYTTSSMKQGIFKSLEITGKNIKANDAEVPYVYLKSLSDYNYIDYTQSPMIFKSDMKFAYELHLDENTLNTALKNKDYDKIIYTVNRLVYPIFVVKDVRAKISDNKLYVLMDYNLPVMKFKQDKTFIMTADFYIENSKIKSKNIKIENYYVKIPLNKVTKILNILSPLDFTLNLFDSKKCKGNIEKMNIVDNVFIIEGKILVKADKVK